MQIACAVAGSVPKFSWKRRDDADYERVERGLL